MVLLLISMQATLRIVGLSKFGNNLVSVNFIAEVSSNHSKDLNRSLEFIDTASKIGCDSIKFQLFQVDKLFAPEILKERKELRKRKEWELPLEFLPEIEKRCKEKNIKLGFTPFYLEAVKELEPFVDFYKIASYELLWDDLLKACARSQKPVILSTGMANLQEINNAVKVLKDNNSVKTSLLHCTSAYPTPYKEANLAAIDTLRKETGCTIGWSDHTNDASVIYRAVNYWGAEIVEFHLDIDGKGEEFSAGHCWLPDQMREIIDNLSKGIEADGSGIKEPVPSEQFDAMWRADPSDGLRPLKAVRKDYKS